MATSGTARFLMSLIGSYEKAQPGGTLKQPISEKLDMSFLDGVGELQFNRYFKKTFAATTTPAVLIDLSGTDVDDFGDVTAATEVVAVIVKHLSPGGGILLVGGGANDIVDMGANFVRKVRPGANATTKPGLDVFLAPDANGSPVTAATGDKITGTASAGTINGEIIVLARA